MDRKKLLSIIFSACLGTALFFSYASAEDVIIIIEPDPGGGVDVPIDPDNPPPPPPAEPPQQPSAVTASINVDPDTLNLKSNRQFLTVYVELPSGEDVHSIQTNTIKITAINHQNVTAVFALGSPSEIGDYDSDGTADVMVKFDYDQIRPLLSAGDLVFSVGGSLTGDKTFAGEDTITAIHEEEESTALAAQSRDTGSGTEEKEYTFSLDKHFTSNVRITSAFLWVKSSGRGQAQSKEARMYKTHRNWETVVGRLCDLTCSSLKRGNGYEWDLTSRVRGDWEQGIFDVVVRLCDEESGRRPMLVVVYEDGTATTEEAFCQQQSLQPMGSRINLPDGNRDPGETLTLCYTESDIQGVAENDLNLYYWDATAIKWEPVPESTKNTVDNTFTCQAKYGRSYQIMAPRSAMTAQTGAGGTNSLGQNYPNPFNPATTIEYAIAKDCHVTLKLYNTAGELVAVMVDEYQQAGAHSVYYDGGERLSRGIYFYQLVAGDFVDTRRMVVLK